MSEGPLIPATRTVTEVRTLGFQELLGHLRIPNGDLKVIHVTAKQDGPNKGTLTITTKTETEV